MFLGQGDREYVANIKWVRGNLLQVESGRLREEPQAVVRTKNAKPQQRRLRQINKVLKNMEGYNYSDFIKRKEEDM